MWKRPKSRRFVYLIGNGPDGSFKIGCSGTPNFRMKTLAASTECNLEPPRRVAR